MSMNLTPSGERIHIGIFGRRNAGKSSLINAMTGQSLSIVCDIEGTTTDPVAKAMELLPLGPVVLIDTPGLDDEGSLGAMRIEKTYQSLNKTDLALLVIDATIGMTQKDWDILSAIKNRNIPFILVLNKCDHNSVSLETMHIPEINPSHIISVSAKTGEHITELKNLLPTLLPGETKTPSRHLVSDLVHPGDVVVLVIPIDKAAPKGRLILPQQQTIRDLLDTGAIPVVTRDSELSITLSKLSQNPALVITDSQVFESVNKLLPPEIPLTSFSILFSRYKGSLETQVQGARTLDYLNEGDNILVSEGCTHHRQCGDIGTEKIPKWIKNYAKKELNFHFTSGNEFPTDLSPYQLVIHCGGCTLNPAEMKHRIQTATQANVPITNYGTTIAHIHGILNRSLEVFQTKE